MLPVEIVKTDRNERHCLIRQ
eukprot:SAG22_NODE_22132_length_251_cov_0.684211_2_plen_20_part_01